MARILAIDYGLKRCGLAVTDPLQMIANPLDTVSSKELLGYLKKYVQEEEVETLVLGLPRKLNGQPTDATPAVEAFHQKLKDTFPEHTIETHDERFTSKMALDAMITGGTSKKYRRNKANIDKVSAVIILQSYLEQKDQNV